MPLTGSRPRRICGILVLLTGAIATALNASLHIQLDSSSPARDEVLTAPPSQLWLLFSARIEARYTSVTLTAPDGARVPIGDVVFVDGSDREITTQLPALVQPGQYAVTWRTAGADGHVLEGTYSFMLAIADDTPGAGMADTAADAGASPALQQEHAHHEEPEAVGGALEAVGRGLHFTALILLLGALGFRVLMLPRLGVADVTYAVLQRRAWWVLSMAALLLAAAAVVRLWLQSVALHGAERAWSTPLLSIMLSDTSWGRAWVLQAFLFALLGMAIVWARPRRPPHSDRVAVLVAIPTLLALAAIPGLSGHAAGATGFGRLAVLNDTLHVAAAGVWLGTLTFIILFAIPAIRQLEAAHDSKAADTVDRFSVIALSGGAVVLVTGLLNTLMHLTAVSQLVTTDYGRTLFLKLVLVAGVGVLGVINWRIVRPLLRRSGGMRRLRLTVGAELAFAVCVVIATAILTGQARP